MHFSRRIKWCNQPSSISFSLKFNILDPIFAPRLTLAILDIWLQNHPGRLGTCPLYSLKPSKSCFKNVQACSPLNCKLLFNWSKKFDLFAEKFDSIKRTHQHLPEIPWQSITLSLTLNLILTQNHKMEYDRSSLRNNLTHDIHSATNIYYSGDWNERGTFTNFWIFSTRKKA